VPVIDGLRGFAILLVLFYHVFEKSHFIFGLKAGSYHFDLHTFIQSGFLGVELFFFVSGFCLMLPYAAWMAGRRPEQTLKEYISRRFWKIVPSYYLSLLILGIYYPFNRQQQIPWSTDMLLHFSFLHAFNWPAFISINGNFWSLAVEVEFYVLFPFIVMGFARAPLITTAIVSILGLEYSAVIAQQHLDGTFIWAYQLPSYLPLFAIGGIAAWVYEKYIRGREIDEDMRLDLAGITIFGVIALGYVFEQLNQAGSGSFAWAWENAHRLEIGLILALFTLSAACAPQKIQAAIANPVLTFFSDISYNMYLWNAAIVAFIASRWVADPGWRGGVFALMALAATTLVGWVLTRFFERPLMRHRFRSPQAIVAWVRGLFSRPKKIADA